MIPYLSRPILLIAPTFQIGHRHRLHHNRIIVATKLSFTYTSRAKVFRFNFGVRGSNYAILFIGDKPYRQSPSSIGVTIRSKARTDIVHQGIRPKHDEPIPSRSDTCHITLLRHIVRAKIPASGIIFYTLIWICGLAIVRTRRLNVEQCGKLPPISRIGRVATAQVADDG